MSHIIEDQTIYSLSSGAGLAGVAIIRISGPQARICIEKMCRKPVPPRYAGFRQLYHPVSGELLDDGLVLWLPGPGTFTGEDITEFQIHGGRATITSVINGLAEIEGYRQAEAGEFTRRAFMNNRLDLVEIEGLGDLIHAQTETQRQQALSQSRGDASRVFNRWRSELTAILGYLEASIDFIEEDDVAEKALEGFQEKLIHLRNDMAKHLNDSARGEMVRDGVRVVLAGRPNVGKSSIINYLAERDVAIVSDIPGTTRDVLEVQLDLNGIPVTLSDTAGLREDAGDEIEQAGMMRARAHSRQADLVIWVTVAGEEPDTGLLETEAEQLIIVNKADLLANGSKLKQDAIYVSAKTGLGMNRLLNTISRIVDEKFGGKEPALISRERQKSAIVMCVRGIDGALENQAGSLELAAEQLRSAANQLSRLVGTIDVEDLLDVIFRDFCVGK